MVPPRCASAAITSVLLCLTFVNLVMKECRKGRIAARSLLLGLTLPSRHVERIDMDGIVCIGWLEKCLVAVHLRRMCIEPLVLYYQGCDTQALGEDTKQRLVWELLCHRELEERVGRNYVAQGPTCLGKEAGVAIDHWFVMINLGIHAPRLNLVIRHMQPSGKRDMRDDCRGGLRTQPRRPCGPWTEWYRGQRYRYQEILSRCEESQNDNKTS